jgi:hypothetical protein
MTKPTARDILVVHRRRSSDASGPDGPDVQRRALLLTRAAIAGIGLILALGLMAAACALEAETDGAHGSEGDGAEDPASGVSGSEKENLTSTSIIPFLFYTPETRLGGGVGVGYFFKEAPEHRPNSINTLAILTTESQAILALTSEIYSPDESHHFEGEVSAEKFPYSFWGVGNSTPDSLEETYTPRSVEFSMLVEKRFLSNLTLGGRYRFWYEKVSEVAGGGLLDSDDIEGSAGGYSSGLGIVSTWDTRDNIHYTRKGLFAYLEATYLGPALGSNYEYGITRVDLRYFTTVAGEHSLGIRTLLRSTSGDTPFQDMPGIGGSVFLRGYPGKRYIDKVAFTTDVEFRTAYFWRVSMVAFGSLGHVAGRVSDLPEERIRFTGGAGLRFRLNDENFNIRMDFGFGEETSGFYFIAGEAF